MMSTKPLFDRQKIITHRGLEPTRKGFFSESTYEAFRNHLDRGFGGIEFDPNFIKDKRIVAAHDGTLYRITKGADQRSMREVSPEEVPNIRFEHGRMAFFEEVMELIRNSESTINAMHIKGSFQNETDLTILISHIKTFASDLIDRFFIFDLRPEWALMMKEALPKLHIAPSVAHPYDIERYNAATKNTLLSIGDALRYKQDGLYDWVWLDEWDRMDRNHGSKKFYTKETFETLREAGYKLGLVTPELHATSPALLGGESHPDAIPEERLLQRIVEIIDLQPDAICTDHPEEVALL